MKKEYVSPAAHIIELQMNENIADSLSDITGSWKFEQDTSTGAKCYEIVSGLKPSTYQGRGITTPQGMKDAGFSTTYYIRILDSAYGPSVTDDIYLLCGTA